MELCSLHAVFERRLLRIPDYQRGYTWEDHQIKDFLEDIIRLDENKMHYTGVVTLEIIKKDIWKEWKQDDWIINGVGYDPFYIVDGQQRLATSMILMQAIIERIGLENEKMQLSYQSIHQIRDTYIVKETADGSEKSFLFGYEKDNPSDKFLKTHIFGDGSPNDSHQKTLYTQNLDRAKEYFTDKLKDMEIKEIESIFKKLTKNIKFNLYEIDNEIDVFVAFETTNNRGKPLSTLELLKNRLIYLSTLLGDDAGKGLRPKINDAWKTIYEYLGKNPDKPLDDDEFLRNHWIMYFGYDSHKNYRDSLLSEEFIAQNITHSEEEKDCFKKKINAYVENLEQSAEPWFYIHNPSHEDFYKSSDEKNKELLDRLNGLGFDEENRKLLDQLNRLGFRAFKPLLLASYVSNKKDVGKIHDLLRTMERYNFIMFELSQYRANTGESEFYGYAKEIYAEEIKKDTLSIEGVIGKINERIKDDEDHIHKYFYNYIERKYKLYTSKKYGRWCEGGFFTWGGLPYFLYEYEEWLCDEGHQSTDKLEWGDLSKEHILPQTLPNSEDNPYWKKHFGKFKEDQRIYLTHSLGNLLPLSGSENSSLGNNDFDTKKNNGKGNGYHKGSASEEKVAKNEDWTAEKIFERGLEMLKFMEERWEIKLGDEKSRQELLHLSFLSKDQQN